jgi:hypothetical protein
VQSGLRSVLSSDRQKYFPKWWLLRNHNRAGMVLGFVVGLAKIHKGYWLRPPPRPKSFHLLPFRKLFSAITLVDVLVFDLLEFSPAYGWTRHVARNPGFGL